MVDLTFEVAGLSKEVPDLRPAGIRLNLTPDEISFSFLNLLKSLAVVRLAAAA